MKRYRYLLGDSRREAARLRFQARLWDPVSHALFDRLGVRPGWKVLEVGPGQGSLHLELRRRVRGPVDAVERSPAFAARLRRLCEADGRGRGVVWETDLLDAPLPAARYDLVFARWVFLFLPDPLAHLRKLAAALKPGGLIALQDYHRETMALEPRPRDWDAFLAADRNFFATQGGDASIGRKLPLLYKQAGLRPLSVEAELKTGGPGTPVWDWASEYFLGVLPRLGAVRPLTPAASRRVSAAWRAAARRPESLFIAPAVLDCVARKPR
ncbi:MAG: class I SAM-dependent methyltransferase [Elusimicrobiota bacterium]|nr:class I SAM-dependent methyltransferase [Elusimicrobiota bacterium]